MTMLYKYILMVWNHTYFRNIFIYEYRDMFVFIGVRTKRERVLCVYD